jgi:hypothetical protein
MIDTNLAKFALSQIVPGERSNFITGPEKRTFEFEVVSLKDFSVIVKSAIGLLIELPISKSEIYIEEHKKMSKTSRMTMPTQQPASAVAQPPARPRRRTKAQIDADNAAALAAKNGQAAPQAAPQPTPQPAFQQPSFAPSFDSWTPPGATPGPQPAVMSDARQSQSWQTGTAPHPMLEGVRVPVTNNLPEAEDNNWIEKAVREAGESFLSEITQIITTVYREQPLEEPAAPSVKTCFDCVMINVNENKCDKYLMTPPLSIIKTAQTGCEGFVSNDEIPY